MSAVEHKTQAVQPNQDSPATQILKVPGGSLAYDDAGHYPQAEMPGQFGPPVIRFLKGGKGGDAA